MLLRDEDTAVFKRWLLPKLETISDAENEVLADYVIALVTVNEGEDSIRRNCIECLSDFLQENTTSFVDTVLDVIKTRKYADQSQHSRPAPIPSIVGTSNLEYEPDPSRPANAPPPNAPSGPKALHGLNDRPMGPSSISQNPNAQHESIHSSRKRKLVHRDASETRDTQDSHYSRGGHVNRPSKQPARRIGKTLRGNATSFEPTNLFSGFEPMHNMLSMANLPPPPPGPVPFDVNNPMAFFAMMAALGSAMPGMPPLPSMIPQPNGMADSQVLNKMCPDYHTKGFCVLGNICPFEHSDKTLPLNDLTQSKGHQRTNRTQDNNLKGGRIRAPFSLPGPSFDRTNTTLVVEQIPEDCFSEDNVRHFFSQFGHIIDVQMQAYKRLAIVKFEDYNAASQAYNSPKAVFDNRFVKVYWYKQDPVTEVSRGLSDDDEVLDLQDIAKRQADAQKAFEARRKKIAAAEARAAEIDRKLIETEAEMKSIKQQLAELTGDEPNESAGENLTKDLAALQAEAESLFAQIDHQASVRGRGYSPRGVYQSRGVRAVPRGVYGGRGTFATPFPISRSAVLKLDNRPRRLAVMNVQKGTSKDEALRQYLVNIPECISIEPHPSQPTTLILTFQERYQAEDFLDASLSIPDTGSLDLAWVPNNAFDTQKVIRDTSDNGDNSSATAGEPEGKEDEGHADDADMDVADDVDRWL